MNKNLQYTYNINKYINNYNINKYINLKSNK